MATAATAIDNRRIRRNLVEILNPLVLSSFVHFDCSSGAYGRPLWVVIIERDCTRFGWLLTVRILVRAART
jgi:hypothetical protein